MIRKTRSISWIRAAEKDFKKFPSDVQDEMRTALTISAEGRKADKTKPLSGFSGVWEVALRYQTDAYRTIYVTEIGGSLWVLHAFKKKSKEGKKTPKPDIDLVRERLKRLKKELMQ